MCILDLLFGNAEGSIDKTAVWTAVLACMTFFLIIVAWSQLSSIKKTTKADYLKRLNDSFFTEETRNLLVLLFNSAIEFSVLPINGKEAAAPIDRLPYFKIDQSILQQLKNNGLISLPEWRKGYNAFEIDDLLLGPLDDVGRFVKNRLLDTRSAYDTFGYYVCELLGDNKEIKAFLEDEDNRGNYDDLEYLYTQFLPYKKEKENRNEGPKETEK